VDDVDEQLADDDDGCGGDAHGSALWVRRVCGGVEVVVVISSLLSMTSVRRSNHIAGAIGCPGRLSATIWG
jgi:hypothetical protein